MGGRRKRKDPLSRKEFRSKKTSLLTPKFKTSVNANFPDVVTDC